MENTSLLASGFTLDDLRVEVLEPRLEFSTAEACNRTGLSTRAASSACTTIQTPTSASARHVPLPVRLS